jgi:chaperonin GroES
MIKPLRDHVIVSAIKADEKTESGLIFKPGIVDEKFLNGKVLAVGSGYLTDSGTIVPLEVQVGDTVAFSRQMAVEAKHQGETFFNLREENILHVVSQ